MSIVFRLRNPVLQIPTKFRNHSDIIKNDMKKKRESLLHLYEVIFDDDSKKRNLNLAKSLEI